jgi:hypothetical protein
VLLANVARYICVCDTFFVCVCETDVPTRRFHEELCVVCELSDVVQGAVRWLISTRDFSVGIGGVAVVWVDEGIACTRERWMGTRESGRDAYQYWLGTLHFHNFASGI